MTGAEHYEQAERLMSMVEREVPENAQFSYFDGDEDTRGMLAAANVHATLALAAAQQQANFIAMADSPHSIALDARETAPYR